MPQVWFVTGSSRGLGRAIVTSALDAGAMVAATARDPKTLDDLLARYGSRVLPLALDVTDPSAVEQAVAETLRRFDRVDVVVNNAGFANMASVEDVTLDDLRHQVDTNFYGTVHVSKAVLPIMRQQGAGHIFQIGSVGSRIASAGLAAYQSAKFAVRGFGLVLAQEVGPLGVKVTIVQPGGMRTDWAGSSMQVHEISEPYRPSIRPFSRMLRDGSGREPGDPRKVARVILGLAGRTDAPAEILIGEDAYRYAASAADAVSEADKAWKTVTTSVAF